MNNDFLFQLKNFEKVFKKNLTSTENNSVDVVFSELSKEFVSSLGKIDFLEYKKINKKNLLLM